MSKLFYDYLSGLMVATLILFVAAVIGGAFSKRTCYSIGIAAAATGVALALLVLGTEGAFTLDLWEVAPGNFAQIAITPFNSYFLLISCLVWLGTCVYSVRYDDDYPKSLSSLLLLTMLSMTLILVAADAILFLLGWETMTIASFFMILEGKGNKRGVLNAAYLFLAFGEASTVLIMLAFSGVFAGSRSLDFLSSSTTVVSGLTASWVFIAALLGFGLKMGIAPFHMSEWLPIAHSSAPANASALLSATLTLMGVYGLINIVTHLGGYQLWWGWVTLAIGGISAILGALFASASEHTKGLPAYSTIENNGLIVVAIGAYILASYYGLALLAELALIAALYHSFSHSISKSSLFLLMGWTSKVKNSFDLNILGPENSLGKRTSKVAGLLTILSLSAVPPLAGFVSEWLILEVLFQSYRYGDIGSQIIGTLVGAVAALAAGIIIVAMTKAYGFGILWSRKVTQKYIANDEIHNKFTSISWSFVYFAGLVIAIGVAAPGIFLLASNASSGILHVDVFALFHGYATTLVRSASLGVPPLFIILSGNPFGGFSPTFVAIFMLGLLTIPYLISLIGGQWRIRRTSGWFGGQLSPRDPSQIYNSFGYSTPIRIMLRALFQTRERIIHVGTTRRAVIFSPEEYFVELEVLDVFKRVYDVIGKWSLAFSQYVGRKFMPGRLSNYLVYIVVAIVFIMIYILVTVL